MTLKEKLAAELEKIQTQARAIAEKDDPSDADKKNLADLLAEGQALQARGESLVAIDAMTGVGAKLVAVQQRESHTDEDLSWGDMFTRSEQFADYRGRGTSSKVEIRALPSTLASMAPAISRTKRLVEDGEHPSPLLTLIPTIPVSQNGFDVVKWTETGGAAVVPEGTLKPSAEYVPSLTPVTLDTIAVYTQLTRQLIEDEAAIRAKIDRELQKSVLRKIESESAAALAGATLPAVTGGSLLEAIRVGIGTVQAEGYDPNAVLLNPADWAALDIAVLGATLLGPSSNSTFWGLRPVASNAQPAGTATVGDFSTGVERYARSGVSVYITDSHADTFLLNVFTILAEARSKTVVVHPDAFAEATAGVTAAAASSSKK